MRETESQPCHGLWGMWGEFSECSKACGSGTQTKNRTCDNPTPMELSEECLMTNGTRGLAEEWVTDCDGIRCPGMFGMATFCGQSYGRGFPTKKLRVWKLSKYEILCCLVLSIRSQWNTNGLGDRVLRVVKCHPMVPTAWPLNRA